MEGKILHLVYSSDLSNVTDLNSSFDSATLRIAYTGINRNGSLISKEVYEKCIHSMYNCPIVCNYDRDTDSIGGHDMDVVSSESGEMSLVNLTTPVGVVPESAKYYWETITEEDGTSHEYLCVDVLLWKRQEAYEKIKTDGIVSESMEIKVNDGYFDAKQGVYVVNDFEFTAFCLLGDGITPCFESASISLFSYEDIKSKFDDMMSDFKTAFSLINSPDAEVEIENINYAEGGREGLEEKIALLNEFGLTEEQLGFSLEDFSLDELRAKLEELQFDEDPEGEDPDGTHEEDAQGSPEGEDGSDEGIDPLIVEPDEDPENDDDDDDESVRKNKFSLAGDIREFLNDASCGITIQKPWGMERRYYLVDFDQDKMEAYFEDAQDWKIYAFPFSMSGDVANVDFSCGKRKKYAFVDFVDGETEEDHMSAVFSCVENKYNEELSVLRQFKMDIDNEREQEALNAVFEQFEDLNGIEEYETLKANVLSYSLNDVEEKCYAIRGRHGSFEKFSAKSAPKIKVMPKSEDIANEPYGGLFVKYGFADK